VKKPHKCKKLSTGKVNLNFIVSGRKKMKRISLKLMSMLVIVLMLGALAGCAKEETTEATTDTTTEAAATEESTTEVIEDMPKVAFIPGDMANESQAFSAKMFEKHAAEYGLELVILDGAGDAQVQAQAVTNAVAQGIKAIYVNPNDINAILPSLMQAKAAGVIVGMFSSDVPAGSEAARDFFVGVNDNMAGEAAAQAFINAFPEGAKIVEIGGQAGHDAQIKRNVGFNTKLEGTTIEMLDVQACEQWQTAMAQAIAEDFITKYGDEIDGVFCHWDNGATGIIEAFKAAGMEGKFIVGVDGNRAGFAQVASGEQAASIAQNFETFAVKALSLTKDVIEGKTIEAVNFIPLDIVTKDNINTFTAPEW
jgi:ribose transport system substrate-binding protein